MSYILVAKSEDHKILKEWINEQRQMKEISRIEAKDGKGRLHIEVCPNNNFPLIFYLVPE